MEHACNKGSIELVKLLVPAVDMANAGNVLVSADGREEIFDYLLTLDCDVNNGTVCSPCKDHHSNNNHCSLIHCTITSKKMI